MARNPIHGLIPFAARVWLRQQKRRVENLLSSGALAREHGRPEDFPLEAARREAPLKRTDSGSLGTHVAEKAENLRIACACLDGLCLAPGQVLSFCETVGPTTRRRGFQDALEMRDGRETSSPGGGLCQLANTLMLLAIDCGFEIVERHRHSFDMFPDANRTVPFGIGATVFYNYVDLRFRNTLPFAVMLRAGVTDTHVFAELRSAEPLPFSCRLVETDHRFVKRDDGFVYRCNKLWIDKEVDGSSTRSLLYENDCRVLYPAEHLVTSDERDSS